jgi:hypothetical protein
MTVVLQWSAGSVRVIPIAVEPEEIAKSAAFRVGIFPTWSSALSRCQAAGVTIFNRDEVESVIRQELRRVA